MKKVSHGRVVDNQAHNSRVVTVRGFGIMTISGDGSRIEYWHAPDIQDGVRYEKHSVFTCRKGWYTEEVLPFKSYNIAKPSYIDMNKLNDAFQKFCERCETDDRVLEIFTRPNTDDDCVISILHGQETKRAVLRYNARDFVWELLFSNGRKILRVQSPQPEALIDLMMDDLDPDLFAKKQKALNDHDAFINETFAFDDL